MWNTPRKSNYDESKINCVCPANKPTNEELIFMDPEQSWTKLRITLLRRDLKNCVINLPYKPTPPRKTRSMLVKLSNERAKRVHFRIGWEIKTHCPSSSLSLFLLLQTRFSALYLSLSLSNISPLYLPLFSICLSLPLPPSTSPSLSFNSRSS